MKEWKKGFVGGLAAAMLCSSMLGGAIAANYQKQATLDYTGIKIKLNGQMVTPKDANGAPVEPFAISGTTYLPVRGVASALGLEVGWDPATQTVILSTPVENTSTASGTVVMEKNGIKVTYLGIERNSESYGPDYKINLKVENFTEKSYTVQSRDVSLNGMMVESLMSETVAAGKAALTSIGVYSADEAGVTAPITSAEFKLHIFGENWEDKFDSDPIVVK